MSEGAPDHRLRDAIRRLLDERAARGGPFALLGIDDHAMHDTGVIAALRGQLARVNEHPDAATPAADEVRLALHSAAAQLLDPKARANLTPSGPDAPPPGSSASPGPQPKTTAQDLLAHDCLLVLARTGGWNGRALRELLRLASARGVDPSLLPRVISELLTTRRPDSSQGQPDRGQPESEPPPVASAAQRPGTPLSSDRFVWPIIAAAAFTLATVFWLLLPSASPSPDRTDRSASPVETEAASPSPQAESRERSRAVAVRDAARGSSVCALVRDIETLLETAESPDAEELAAILRRAGAVWRGWPEPERRSFESRFVELAVRDRSAVLVAGSLASRVAGVAEDQSTAIGEATLAFGLASRLLSEPALPTDAQRALAGAIGPALGNLRTRTGDPFIDGARAGISFLADELRDSAAPLDRWEGWIETVGALAERDGSDWAYSQLLNTTEALLDASANSPAAIATIPILAAEIDWQADENRSLLIDWLRDDTLAPVGISVLIGELARTGVEGVRIGDTPGSSAGITKRRLTAAAFAERWGLATPRPIPPAPEGWFEALASISQPNSGDPAAEWLKAAARLAELNAAASLTLAGRTAGPSELIERAATEPQATADKARVDLGSDRQRGTDWLVGYLAGDQSAASRIDALRNAQRRGLGSGDADVIVSEAFTGRPNTVRQAAEAVVRARIDEALFINAMLEFAPTIPRTVPAARLWSAATLEPAPSPGDPDWAAIIRTGLVRRLASMLGGGDGNSIDTLATRIADAYHARSAGWPATGQDQREGRDPADEARAVLDNLRAQAANVGGSAGGLSLGGIDRTLARRLTVTADPLRAFVAYQAASAEAQTILTATTNPEAQQAYERSRDAHSSASTAFEQIYITEALMAELHRLRFATPQGARG